MCVCVCVCVCVCKNATPLNFAEKKIVNSQKTLKVAEVFSLESFPLYGDLGYVYYTVLQLSSHSLRR